MRSAYQWQYGHKRPFGAFRSIIARQASRQARASATPIVRHGFSYYWDTAPPSQLQLKDGEQFFLAAPPKFIDSATRFRTVRLTHMPEVAFLGRSNVGKSSLLNALMGKDVCHTSKHPGRTRSMNFFAVGGPDHRGNPGKLAILDMPGYGKGSQAEWGPEIVKYLTERKQLKRAFVLIDPQHGMKPADEQLLSLLRQNGVAHQVLLSKIDRVLFPNKKISRERMENNMPVLDGICTSIRLAIQPRTASGPEALGELICCSAEAKLDGQKLGIGSLRWAVLVATALANRSGQPFSVVEHSGPLQTAAVAG